jgi:dolichol-phosphate mannosyltransferase
MLAFAFVEPEKMVGEVARAGVDGAGEGRTLLTVVVPTRNEAENVPRLARELGKALEDVDYRLVFVDDSDDATPEVIRALEGEDGRIVMIHREGEEQAGGLSTAVTTGIDAVAASSEYLCVMDADLQHPPGKVREMLEEAREGGADVVVASRYAKGGSYAGLSGPGRRAVSVGTKYLAQLVFKEARKTSDPLGGFFLVRSAAISGLQFRPTGFKILLEILVCAPELRVVEVPLSFMARHAGYSKATMRQGLEYLVHIASLFFYVPSAGRFWKFALVGASGVLVNLLTLVALVELLGVDHTIGWLFAVGLSILSNFLLNSAFTWRDVRHSSRIHFLLRGALAYPVAIIAQGANFAVYYPLLTYVSDDFPYYVLFAFLGIVAGTSANFILSSRLVFKPSAPKNLDPTLPPEEVCEIARRELKADRVLLLRASADGGLYPVAGSSRAATAPGGESLSGIDRGAVELALGSGQPALVVTGPTRLPQARTNARWASALVVPVPDDAVDPVGVVYAARTSTEQFAQEDLHWLTAYSANAAQIFLR